VSKIIVSIYVHPEFYPPTLNAIINLAEQYEKVVVITRNNIESNFPFPKNVKIKNLGRLTSVIESEKQNLLFKVLFFVKFLIAHIPYLFTKHNKFLCYDPIPLFTISLLCKLFFIKRHIWYHNHDMPNINNCRKYSISWFASKYEKKSMKKITLFSLPSIDRLIYYDDVDMTNIEFKYLPNYPSRKIFFKSSAKKIDNEIRVLYQGSIATLRGFEEFGEYMANSSLELFFTLKGPIRNNYQYILEEHFLRLNILNKIKFEGVTNYIDLINDMSKFHIGLAIQLGDDEIRKTLGTASNKIYEYAASGMPVIITDNQQFRKYLANEDWVFFYSKEKNNLSEIIHQIILNFQELSNSARISFERKYNFENYFNK
jgi:glycosyltransferase involved in cell wall biosynthesis